MPKHTPGPWKLRHTGKHDGDRCLYAATRDICRIDGGPGDDHEQFANACLIAAAPELLGLLKRFATIAQSMPEPFVGEWNWPELAKEARKVIAKATAE
jgi:hypothetical protein